MLTNPVGFVENKPYSLYVVCLMFRTPSHSHLPNYLGSEWFGSFPVELSGISLPFFSFPRLHPSAIIRSVHCTLAELICSVSLMIILYKAWHLDITCNNNN